MSRVVPGGSSATRRCSSVSAAARATLRSVDPGWPRSTTVSGQRDRTAADRSDADGREEATVPAGPASGRAAPERPAGGASEQAPVRVIVEALVVTDQPGQARDAGARARRVHGGERAAADVA